MDDEDRPSNEPFGITPGDPLSDQPAGDTPPTEPPPSPPPPPSPAPPPADAPAPPPGGWQPPVAPGVPVPPPPPGYPPPAPGAQPPQAPPPGYPPSPPPGYPPPGPAGYPPPGPAGYPPPGAPGTYPPGHFSPVVKQPLPRGAHGEPIFEGRELAKWGSRVGAALLDAIFVILILAVPVGGGAALASASSSAAKAIGVILIIAGVAFGYLVYAPIFMRREGERNGQTLGKQVVGIRVVREGGAPMTFGWALLREFVIRQLLIGGVGSIVFGLPALLDVLWPLWDDENRALHDMLASTRVVRADG